MGNFSLDDTLAEYKRLINAEIASGCLKNKVGKCEIVAAKDTIITGVSSPMILISEGGSNDVDEPSGGVHHFANINFTVLTSWAVVNAAEVSVIGDATHESLNGVLDLIKPVVNLTDADFVAAGLSWKFTQGFKRSDIERNPVDSEVGALYRFIRKTMTLTLDGWEYL